MFIPYIIESHLIPTLGIAKLLRKSYNIVYALPKKFQWFPGLHGYNYINLESVPFAFGYEPVIRRSEGSKSVYLDSFRDRRNGRIANHRRKKLNAITDEIKPVFIFSDILSATDFILLYPYLEQNKVAFAIHNPMLSTYTMKGIPRIGSSLTTGQGSKVFLENTWVRIITALYKCSQSVLYPFYTDNDLVSREFVKNKIPTKFKLAKDNHFTKLFEQVPEIITAPEELEFDHSRKKVYQYYVGPLTDERRIEKSTGEDLTEVFNRIMEWKQDKNNRIVYCAFGTMSQKSSMSIGSFIEKLFLVFEKHPALKLICAFNGNSNFINNDKQPQNVLLFNYLPQLYILRHADLFITHAGLGSVKEAIFYGVPMLAYPFTKSWDSNGNATKIAYRRLGLRGNILTDDAQQIEERIMQLLTQMNYRETMQLFREKMTVKYSEENFLTLFEKLRVNTSWGSS